MKELEKTKRISISAVLFILVILIGVLSFKRPKNTFQKDKYLTLNQLVKTDYLIEVSELKNAENSVLIDVRSPFDFEKATLKNAINIYTPNILDEDQIEYLTNVNDLNKTIILFGNSPQDAIGPWILLTQMGLNNVKVLKTSLNVINNKLVIAKSNLENPIFNYAEFIKNETNSKSAGKIVKKAPKKVIRLVKKKKKVAEGGC